MLGESIMVNTTQTITLTHNTNRQIRLLKTVAARNNSRKEIVVLLHPDVDVPYSLVVT